MLVGYHRGADRAGLMRVAMLEGIGSELQNILWTGIEVEARRIVHVERMFDLLEIPCGCIRYIVSEAAV